MESPVFVSFGEVLLRLSPPSHQRLLQARSLNVAFGGGEANVAVSLAQWGVPSAFVTAVPDNDIGQASVNELRGWGVDTTEIVRAAGRMGIYFLEHGASQRPSNVIYDRAGSSISLADPAAFDWERIFKGAKWFHFTGITPALSSSATQAVGEAAAAAKRLGLTVSCDVNYRKKLWTRDQASVAMTELMANVDVLIANEEDADSVFGVAAAGTDVKGGRIDPDAYREVARKLTDRFGLKAVAITLRESHSASRNGWSGMLFSGGQARFSRQYDIDVVDRVGAGDSFAAGLIFGYLRGMGPQAKVDFAAAASCLKHTVPGDFNVSSVAEVEALLKSGGSGRVQR